MTLPSPLFPAPPQACPSALPLEGSIRARHTLSPWAHFQEEFLTDECFLPQPPLQSFIVLVANEGEKQAGPRQSCWVPLLTPPSQKSI